MSWDALHAELVVMFDALTGEVPWRVVEDTMLARRELLRRRQRAQASSPVRRAYMRSYNRTYNAARRSNPEAHARHLAYLRDYKKRRRATDPAFRERELEANRASAARRKARAA